MTSVVGAILIGLTLGLLGSGGSILTVPVLVYLLGHQDKVAIAESLAIVGGIALAGMIPYARARLIDWRSVVLFGLPGMAGTYGGAWLARFVSGPAQLTLFAGVMLIAAWMMIRRPAGSAGAATEPDEPHEHPYWMIALEGLAVGILTGLVGVGGGFLIVPALVLLGGLSMRMAVGTSLVVIALKSFSGFFKYLGVLQGLDLSVDWGTIGLFLAIGVVGSFVGHQIGSRINQLALRRGFAVFLIVMGLFVLGREIPRVAGHTADSLQKTSRVEVESAHPGIVSSHQTMTSTEGT
ncbi:MAG: sulfite exporter TauE/SafE family protein [Maioricimonas sp. JB045]